MKSFEGKLYWQAILAGLFTFVCLWSFPVWADTLTSGSNKSAGVGNYTTSFADETSVQLTSLTAGAKVLVVATFSCTSVGTDTSSERTAHFALTNETTLTPDSPNGLLRSLSGSSDNGIGSIVHIYTAVDALALRRRESAA